MNVELINIDTNCILSLDENIFSSLVNLKLVYIDSNDLEKIPENLFKNNLKLQGVWMQNNKIMFINASMFDHFSHLTEVGLSDNVCVDRDYTEMTDLDSLRSDLRQNCTEALSNKNGSDNGQNEVAEASVCTQDFKTELEQQQ